MTLEEVERQLVAAKQERDRALINYGVALGKVESLEQWRASLSGEPAKEPSAKPVEATAEAEPSLARKNGAK